MHDEEIIARVLSGDDEAYRSLVERHQCAVWGFIHSVVRNGTDADDVAQEVFVAAFTHLDSFDARRAKFVTWLLTIARNRCSNHLKRRLVRERVTTEADAVEGSSQLDHLAGSGLSPDRVVSHRETEELLDDALEQLPLEQKTAFVLAEIQELSLSEIAAVEGVPVGTVKSRISRAKEKLRRVLNGLMSTERLSEK
jgi:RNA polymerase sigma-70 factor, ECF subfamily